MSGTSKDLRALALATAKRVLRPVGRALVIYGWLWLPGPPPKELFDWPAKDETPAAPPRRAELEQLDWRRL